MTRGLFLDMSPDNFSSMKSCFVFVGFTFKIKVSIILKMIKWKYKSTKQNWLVCELGNVLPLNRFWFQNLTSDPKSYRAFHKTAGPRTACYCPYRSVSLLQLVMSSCCKKVLLSVHARTSEANILHLDQMVMKCMTCMTFWNALALYSQTVTRKWLG